MKKRIGIQGFFVFLSLFLSVFLSKFFFPIWRGEVVDETLNVLGTGMVLFGFLFRVSARGYKAERSWDGEALITDGPYTLTRHPMYFGTLLIGLGIIMILLNGWTLPPFLIVFVLIYLPQIRREERLLTKNFGDTYEAYCKKTPSYFPHLYSLLTLGLKESLPLKARWFKKELVSLMGVFITTVAGEVWEDARLFGRAECLKELRELLSIWIAYFVILLFLYRVEKQGRPIEEGRPIARQKGG